MQRFSRFFWLLICFSLLVVSAQAKQPDQLTFWGMNTYLTGFERINPIKDDLPKLAQLGKEANVNWAREELGWANIEKHGKGRWEWYNFDGPLKTLAEADYGIVGMLLTTPDWARVTDCVTRTQQFAAVGVVAEKYWCPPAKAQDFADFVTAAVERYDGDGVKDAAGSPRIAVWQLWNEPNAWETWPGTPAEYGALLQAGYAAIKAADPTASVTTGGLYVFDGSWNDGKGHQDGLAFFEQTLTSSPGAWSAFDSLTIHPYMPDVAPDQESLLSKVIFWGRLATAKDWLTAQTQARGGAIRPLWIGEVGWPACTSATSTAAWANALARYHLPTEATLQAHELAQVICKTEQQQANYLVRAQALALAQGVQHLSYFQLEDKFDGTQAGPWGAMALLDTVNTGYRQKLGYAAYKTQVAQLKGATFLGFGALNTFSYNSAKNAIARYHLRFQGPGNELIDLIWRNSGSETVDFALEAGRNAFLISLYGVQTPLTASSKASLDLSEQPIYVRQELPATATPTPSRTLAPTNPPPNTPTATPSPTPTQTATRTVTPSPTATIATKTPTKTATSTPLPDVYEPDTSCKQATTLTTDGIVQDHSFQPNDSEDWATFDAISGTIYLIQANVYPNSKADLQLDLRSACEGQPLITQNYTYTNDVRLSYLADANQPLYLKLTDSTNSFAKYDLTVRQLRQQTPKDLVIIVGGELAPDDPLKTSFSQAVTQTYQLFKRLGYPAKQLYLLTRDSYDQPLNPTQLQGALTTWASQAITLGAESSLTLFLIGHGEAGLFYLDKPKQQTIMPADLASWFRQLEVAQPGVKINLVVEADDSGGFIEQLKGAEAKSMQAKVGQTGIQQRVIIASTGAKGLAAISPQGMFFSTYFLASLERGGSLYRAFQEAKWALEVAHPAQVPSLESNDNGLSNEKVAGLVAQQRSFGGAADLAVEEWPPFIREVSGPSKLLQKQESSLTVTVSVQAQTSLKRIWAEVYAPKAQLTSTQTIDLRSVSQERYTTKLSGLQELGSYRLVLYGEDQRGNLAGPAALAIEVVALPTPTVTPTVTHTVTPSATQTAPPMPLVYAIFLPQILR